MKRSQPTRLGFILRCAGLSAGALLGAVDGAGAMETIDVPWIPVSLEACAERAKAPLHKDQNPPYLRGDFDADGTADVAAVVRVESGQIALLVCTHEGKKPWILGGGVGQPFSDMRDDAFISPQWQAVSAREAQSEIPDCAKYVRRDGILMIWEDGLGLIGWDGTAFRWCAWSSEARPSDREIAATGSKAVETLWTNFPRSMSAQREAFLELDRIVSEALQQNATLDAINARLGSIAAMIAGARSPRLEIVPLPDRELFVAVYLLHADGPAAFRVFRKSGPSVKRPFRSEDSLDDYELTNAGLRVIVLPGAKGGLFATYSDGADSGRHGTAVLWQIVEKGASKFGVSERRRSLGIDVDGARRRVIVSHCEPREDTRPSECGVAVATAYTYDDDTEWQDSARKDCGSLPVKGCLEAVRQLLKPAPVAE